MPNKALPSFPEGRSSTQCPAYSGGDNGDRAQKLDDDALMLVEEGLRAHLPDVDDIVARAAARKQRKKVASVLLLFALVGGVFWLDPGYYSEQVATEVGERGRWTMHDGSDIALNTTTVLRVDYHFLSRQLSLAHSEPILQ